MKGKIFLVLLISLCIVTTLWAALTNTNPFRLKGIFSSLNGWSGIAGVSPFGGYPGKVDYSTGGAQIYPDLNSNGFLSGNIWMGNVGWVTFSHGGLGQEVLIKCPPNIWSQSDQLCPLTGGAWSQNAGWIVFSGSEIGVDPMGYTYS